jgi:hypothetical protein
LEEILFLDFKIFKENQSIVPLYKISRILPVLLPVIFKQIPKTLEPLFLYTLEHGMKTMNIKLAREC